MPPFLAHMAAVGRTLLCPLRTYVIKYGAIGGVRGFFKGNFSPSVFARIPSAELLPHIKNSDSLRLRVRCVYRSSPQAFGFLAITIFKMTFHCERNGHQHCSTTNIVFKGKIATIATACISADDLSAPLWRDWKSVVRWMKKASCINHHVEKRQSGSQQLDKIWIRMCRWISSARNIREIQRSCPQTPLLTTVISKYCIFPKDDCRGLYF